MSLTVDQVAALAPDGTSLAAGKKLASPRAWRSTGQNESAVWGECQGSTLYQVRVDRSAFGYKCSCPSRKLPCKHVLGLLFLAADTPEAVLPGEPPEWVAEWLAKRAARAPQSEQKKAERAKPPDPEAQAKRAGQRQERVLDGLDRLDLWMHDLVRSGLAGLEQQGPSPWEEQARRLVDAQAPGLASRLRQLGEIPGSGRDWPARLLAGLGRLALLCHAYRRLERLDPALRDDVRQFVGWNVPQEELAQRGEQVADRWLIVGQRLEDEDRLRVQRSWLVGRVSRRTALVLQFSAAGQPFPEAILPGREVEGTLVYWPGAAPQRARFLSRPGETLAIAGPPPGAETIEDFLQQTAQTLARQPWTERFLAILRNVTPSVRNEAHWQVHDLAGLALPLGRGERWKLLALSGGRPVDLVGEWDGERLTPLGVYVESRYYLLAPTERAVKEESGAA